MSQEIAPRLLDKRTQVRHIAKGRISKEAFDGHIASLTDLADQADNIAPKLYETEGETAVSDAVTGEA